MRIIMTILKISPAENKLSHRALERLSTRIIKKELDV
jgi:hypothetical protein